MAHYEIVGGFKESICVLEHLREALLLPVQQLQPIEFAQQAGT